MMLLLSLFAMMLLLLQNHGVQANSKAQQIHAINQKPLASSIAITDAKASKNDFLKDLHETYRHQPIFLQAVDGMADSLQDLFADTKMGDFYKRAFLAMTEPERTLSFRVPWMDDNGNVQFNRGWRVEFSRYVLSTGRKFRCVSMY
jgi:hypothetical protein